MIEHLSDAEGLVEARVRSLRQELERAEAQLRAVRRQPDGPRATAARLGGGDAWHASVERALEQALDRLRSHVENSPLAVIEWSAEYRVVGWSAEAARLFGWRFDEVRGKRIDELRLVHADDRAGAAELMANLDAGSRPRSVKASRNVAKDGSIRWCQWYNSALHGRDGRIASVLSQVLDVTAQREAEDALRRSEALSCGIAHQARAVPERAGAIQSGLGLDRNVTDRKGLEAREEEAQREAALRQAAESAVRAKDEFLAMLGHELRNPLAPILTAVQLLRLSAGDAFARERAIIERQAQHMMRLVDDLLDISRITRGKVALKRGPVDLAETIARAVEMASPLLEEGAHALEISVPHGLVVDGDGDRLAQVFANLLTNAAKYTPRGGRVEVRAGVDGDRVQVSVRDEGMGITPELLPRLFDAFVQGERRVERGQGGLGLGLALVKQLTELHGGRVLAKSDGPGRGSEFLVELPARAAPCSAVGATPPERQGPPGSSGGRRVLVVDDNTDAA